MKIRLTISGFLVILGSAILHSQSPVYSAGAWHLSSLTGEVDLKTQHRQLKSNLNEILENQRSTYFLGDIKLNTTSYFWDPNVITLNIGGEFSPENRAEKYIAVPDRSEVRTLKKIDLMTTLLNNKPVRFNGFFNYDQNFFNRELLTNVRSANRQWGGMLSLKNRILPLSVTYRKVNWNQEETETGRMYTMNQENLQGRATRSFGPRDRHELIYTHADYLYRYAGFHQTHNRIERASLTNNVFFDKSRKYNFSSRISWHNQQGSNIFRRFEILENLTFDLPYRLRFIATGNLYNLKDPLQTWDQKRATSTLQHKLFESLVSKLHLEYSQSTLKATGIHTESDFQGGVDLQYHKQIPTGYLNLHYRYYRHHHTTKGTHEYLQVLNEEHVLSDGSLTLLIKPYVETASLVVKDLTGTMIYQQDFDYIVVERAQFIEIQRVPGGQIPNNASILVDYTYRQPGSYRYEANNNQFGASILLFNHLVELYYRLSVQKYPRVESGDFLTLNSFTQHIYGARLDLGVARGGIEFDRYASNIIPYRLRRYYIALNWNIKSKFLLNLDGNVRDYRMIADEVNQLYSNVSGKITYRIRPGMTVSVQSGYLNQRGHNIDLDLLTGRAEFHTAFRRLHLRTGLEMYRRMYLKSSFYFNGAYVQLTRKF